MLKTYLTRGSGATPDSLREGYCADDIVEKLGEFQNSGERKQFTLERLTQTPVSLCGDTAHNSNHRSRGHRRSGCSAMPPKVSTAF
jgi:hypothetical protein